MTTQRRKAVRQLMWELHSLKLAIADRLTDLEQVFQQENTEPGSSVQSFLGAVSCNMQVAQCELESANRSLAFITAIDQKEAKNP
jgi:hypothetical protein